MSNDDAMHPATNCCGSFDFSDLLTDLDERASDGQVHAKYAAEAIRYLISLRSETREGIARSADSIERIYDEAVEIAMHEDRDDGPKTQEGFHRAGLVHVYAAGKRDAAAVTETASREIEVLHAERALEQVTVQRDALHMVVSLLAAKAEVDDEALIGMLDQAKEELQAKRWLT